MYVKCPENTTAEGRRADRWLSRAIGGSRDQLQIWWSLCSSWSRLKISKECILWYIDYISTKLFKRWTRNLAAVWLGVSMVSVHPAQSSGSHWLLLICLLSVFWPLILFYVFLSMILSTPMASTVTLNLKVLYLHAKALPRILNCYFQMPAGQIPLRTPQKRHLQLI